MADLRHFQNSSGFIYSSSDPMFGLKDTEVITIPFDLVTDELLTALASAGYSAWSAGEARRERCLLALREALIDGRPKPETFKPGDVVRKKVNGDTYTLTMTGYLRHADWQHFSSAHHITSEHYERVES